MKKHIISLSYFLLFALIANAQNFDFGVQAGANFATLSGEESDNYNSRIAINVGVTGEYFLGESFGLSSGIIYSAQGATLEQEGSEANLKLDYFNVPVMLKYYLGVSGLSLEAGPQVGFLINGDFDSLNTSTDTELEAKSIDLSLGTGLSYKFRRGSTLDGLSVGARYMSGLNDVFEDADRNGLEVSNNVFSVNLGYRF